MWWRRGRAIDTIGALTGYVPADQPGGRHPPKFVDVVQDVITACDAGKAGFACRMRHRQPLAFITNTLSMSTKGLAMSTVARSMRSIITPAAGGQLPCELRRGCEPAGASGHLGRNLSTASSRAPRSPTILGCGSGILACDLARRGIETVGVDGAAGMLAIARPSLRRTRGLDRDQLRGATPPRSSRPERWRPADAVISSSALEYLPSLPEALRSIHGMLRPGGVLVFSVSNRAVASAGRWCAWCMGYTGRPALFRAVATVQHTGAVAGWNWMAAGFDTARPRALRPRGSGEPAAFAD